jgi:uncharacterized membrane protein
MSKDRVIERKRNVLTRAKAERQIATAPRGSEALDALAARPEFAKHANKHVRAKLGRKIAAGGSGATANVEVAS